MRPKGEEPGPFNGSYVSYNLSERTQVPRPAGIASGVLDPEPPDQCGTREGFAVLRLTSTIGSRQMSGKMNVPVRFVVNVWCGGAVLS